MWHTPCLFIQPAAIEGCKSASVAAVNSPMGSGDPPLRWNPSFFPRRVLVPPPLRQDPSSFFVGAGAAGHRPPAHPDRHNGGSERRA